MSASPSELHVCRAVLTALDREGLDPAVAHVDLLIGRVAARQHRVITTAQLHMLGLGRGGIAGRVRRGVLHRLHRGVYLWGAPVPSLLATVHAAILVCGAGATATHEAARALWALGPRPSGPLDITVPGRHVRVGGIRTHETVLQRADVRTLHGISLTAPARTLLDVAATLTPGELATALEQAQIKRLVTKGAIAATIARNPRQPGARALRALAEDSAFTRSAAERRLRTLLRAAKLPPPACNVRVEGFEVDVLWRRERVVLEFDSYAFHATRTAFERDRQRTAALQRARYAVLRTTWRELTGDSLALVARVAEALALSAGSPTSSSARACP